MKWVEAYATGVERIDRQHRMLFQVVADYRAALDEGGGERTYPSLLRFLDRYIREHFRNEEECMERHRCPMAGCHQEAHAKFAGYCRGYRERYTARGFHAEDARELVDSLEAWLVNHISRIDVQIKDCVLGRRPDAGTSV